MIGIIGCGRVGISFARYLVENEVEVKGVYDTDPEKAGFCGRELGLKVLFSAEKLLVSSKIVLVSVPDDNISEVWDSIKACDLRGKTIVHTSGSLSADIFSGNSRVSTASLHPMMTFTGDEVEAAKMKEITYAYEGDAPQLEALLIKLGNRYFRISREDKVRYHLAGVYTSNILTGVIARGIENLSSCGLEIEHVREILLPLVEKTIENIFTKGSREALTGPVARGDLGTIEKHLICQGRDERGLYIEGSRELLRLSGRRDKKIEELLEEYS